MHNSENHVKMLHETIRSFVFQLRGEQALTGLIHECRTFQKQTNIDEQENFIRLVVNTGTIRLLSRPYLLQQERRRF